MIFLAVISLLLFCFILALLIFAGCCLVVKIIEYLMDL